MNNRHHPPRNSKMEQWIRTALVPIIAQIVTAVGVYLGQANSVKTEVAPLVTQIAVINTKLNMMSNDVDKLKEAQDRR